MELALQKKIFRSARQSKAWSRFSPATIQKRKAALIIGMNCTEYMDLEPHDVPHQDVEEMARQLTSLYDFNTTVILSDRDGTPQDLIPTRANIMRELKGFIPSNPQSDYFFVFSGHSSRRTIPVNSIDEEQREESYIIPYDAIDEETDMVDLDKVITDQILHQYLVADLPEDSQLMALWSTCSDAQLLEPQYLQPRQVESPIPAFLRNIKQTILSKKRSRKRQQMEDFRHTCVAVTNRASWFKGSRSFTISGGHFYNSAGPMTIAQAPQEDISTGLIPGLHSLHRRDIHLHKEIHKGRGYRLHAGENDGKAVVVKVFEGRHSEKISLETVKFSTIVMHPCFLQISAAASRNSDVAFLVFSGDCQGTVESIMRVTLLQNLEKGFVLGLQTVIALSSGLDYLQDINYPLFETKAESFVLLLSRGDTVVISFDPKPSNRRRRIQLDEPDVSNRKPERSETVINLLSEIIQKTFYLPCEEYYMHELPGLREPSLMPSESNGAQPLHDSSVKDLGPRNEPLSLERISRDAEAILNSFLLDPSLDRYHGRPIVKPSRCCQRNLNKPSKGHNLLDDTSKGSSVTDCILSTIRRTCSGCSDIFQDGEEKPSTEIHLAPRADNFEASDPYHGTMIEAVADFLSKDPSPKYREILQTAMAHIWTSGNST